MDQYGRIKTQYGYPKGCLDFVEIINNKTLRFLICKLFKVELNHISEAWWPHGLSARLRTERPGLEPWLGAVMLCSWARHFTLIVPLLEGSRNIPSRYMLQKPG